MAPNKITKRGPTPSASELRFNRRALKVNTDRRICRQMLDQILNATYQLGLPQFAKFAVLGTAASFLILGDQKANQDHADSLGRERVNELRQLFAKGPVEKDIRKRAADSRRRVAGMADLRSALEYINLNGIKRKQNDDGSYEPLEDEDGEENIDEEEEGDEDEVDDEEEENEEETDRAEMEEDDQEGQTESDIEMGDAADDDEQVERISRGVRRLKLVVHEKA